MFLREKYLKMHYLAWWLNFNECVQMTNHRNMIMENGIS